MPQPEIHVAEDGGPVGEHYEPGLRKVRAKERPSEVKGRRVLAVPRPIMVTEILVHHRYIYDMDLRGCQGEDLLVFVSQGDVGDSEGVGEVEYEADSVDPSESIYIRGLKPNERRNDVHRVAAVMRELNHVHRLGIEEGL